MVLKKEPFINKSSRKVHWIYSIQKTALKKHEEKGLRTTATETKTSIIYQHLYASNYLVIISSFSHSKI